MNAYTITISGEGEAKAKLQKFGRSPGLDRAVGLAAQDAVKEYYFRLDGERANAMGGKRSHFYHKAGMSAQWQPVADGVSVSVTQLGLRQRWLGGTIRAVNAKYLAIPARTESYGIRPREFPGDLQFIKFKSGAAALVKDDQSHGVDMDSGGYRVKSAERGEKRTRKKGVGLVEYWLVPSVYQRPDPTAVPSPEYLLNAVTEAASTYLGGFNL